jgi:uncharacterized metal-binding protein YceD (DUF177 family)
MIIDLNELLYKDEIIVDEVINYDKDYLKNTDILKLDNVKISGNITKDYEENTVFTGNLEGIMYLKDAITLESVPYEFQVEIEEILENSLKTLDLIEFLWHYIVLEIPIRYTTSDISELKSTYEDVFEEGDVPEVNNPFKDFFKE